MKLKFVIILLFISSFLNAQEKTKYTDKNGKSQWWGLITEQDLKEEPFKRWYEKSVANFEPGDHEDVREGLKGVEVKIFMGTWCGDSKRWVPRFIDQWKALGLDLNDVEIIAVHNSDSLYKKAFKTDESHYHLHRVPTFIFSKNGVESARIVESPINDLFTDMSQIALGFPSLPRYRAVNNLITYFDTTTISDYDLVDIGDLAKKMSRKSSYPGELNTYAKKLMTQGLIDRSLLVLKLNRELYPYHPFVYQQLGVYYDQCGEIEMALEFYQKSLALEPDNPQLISKIYSINNTISSVNK